jgi:Mg2+/citrate symporter
VENWVLFHHGHTQNLYQTAIITLVAMSWRIWIRPAVYFLYFVVLCIALPLCVWELHEQKAQTHVEAWFVAGIFVFLTVPISLWGILQHLVNNTKPELQRRVVR